MTDNQNLTQLQNNLGWTPTQAVNWLSGEYLAVVSGATVENLEVPGAPLKNDWGCCRI